MQRTVLVLVLALAACGKDGPTRGECARATAHVILLEDVESLTGDADLAQEVGKDFVKSEWTEDEAWSVIKQHDRGTQGSPDGVARVDHCVAHLSRSQVQCMYDSTTPAKAHACLPAAGKR